jgi:hypothetical protein
MPELLDVGAVGAVGIDFDKMPVMSLNVRCLRKSYYEHEFSQGWISMPGELDEHALAFPDSAKTN